MKYEKKLKKISAIISSKKGDIFYKKRKSFLVECSNNSKIDIYGKGWGKKLPLGDNYKGELGGYFGSKTLTTKFDGLIHYQYSIALENYPQDLLVSEKFTDCILSWCIPVYSGNKRVLSIFPEDSYHYIDINDEKSVNEVEKIINRNITKKNIKALGIARNIILDKINIWECIYQIINNNDKYTANYTYP